MKLVATYFRALRNYRGLTQEQVADQLGIGVATIKNWEAGKHQPKTMDLARWAEVVNGSFDHIKRLLVDDQANKEKALHLAQIQVKRNGLTEEQIEFLESLTPAQLKSLIDFYEGREPSESQ